MRQTHNPPTTSEVACYLRYVVKPSRLEDFERYAKSWIDWVNQAGGHHHGYFLPSEGANNIALALFSFPSLARYAAYREASFLDPDRQKVYKEAQASGCIVSYERSFFRPMLAEVADAHSA